MAGKPLRAGIGPIPCADAVGPQPGVQLHARRAGQCGPRGGQLRKAVPEFAQDALGTAKIGFNIDPITAPQIPYLAQGAVIPANHEFLAVLGDQTNGTNVEAPLETIQQALAEVLAEWGGQDITIRFAASGGLEQLVRLLMPYIDKEKARRGARLVVGGN